MKKLLLFAGAAMMAISGYAQSVDELTSNDEYAPISEESVTGLSATDVVVQSKPMRTKENGVYYELPMGLVYRGGSTSAVGSTYNAPIWYAAPFHSYKFTNKCTNPSESSWWLVSSNGNRTSIAEEYPEYIDGNDLNYYFGNPSLTGSKIIPSIEVGDVSYKWGTVKYDGSVIDNQYVYVRPDLIKLTFTAANFYHNYTGFSGNVYGFGTGRTLNHAVVPTPGDTIVNQVRCVAAKQFYPVPETPLYFESIVCNGITNTQFFAGDQKLTATIYKAKLRDDMVNANGEAITPNPANCWHYEIVGDPIAVMTADANSLSGEAVVSNTRTKAWITFKNKQTDAFGNEYIEPVVIDGAFCVVVSGFDQEGVDAGIYMIEADNTFPYTIHECVRTDDGTPYDELTTKYYIHLEFFGMLDGAKVYTEGSFYTDETKTETYMAYDLNKFQISDDGTKMLKNTALTSARLYTAMNWTDEDGNENYYFVDEEGNDELPEWLTGYEIDNSTWESTNSEGKKSYSYYSKATFTAEPLPEGVDYREAKLYVKSDKGALSADPIILYQGSVSAGINDVVLDNSKDNQLYNLMGQKVNRAQQGIFIKNGKKFMVK